MIVATPRPGSPTMRAQAPCSSTSEEALEWLPSLSFRRWMRNGCASRRAGSAAAGSRTAPAPSVLREDEEEVRHRRRAEPLVPDQFVLGPVAAAVERVARRSCWRARPSRPASRSSPCPQMAEPFSLRGRSARVVAARGQQRLPLGGELGLGAQRRISANVMVSGHLAASPGSPSCRGRRTRSVRDARCRSRAASELVLDAQRHRACARPVELTSSTRLPDGRRWEDGWFSLPRRPTLLRPPPISSPSGRALRTQPAPSRWVASTSGRVALERVHALQRRHLVEDRVRLVQRVADRRRRQRAGHVGQSPAQRLARGVRDAARFGHFVELSR